MATHSGPSHGAALGRDDRRAPMLRVAVTGSAIAGAVALIVAAGPLRPEIYVSTGAAVIVAAIIYLVQPRAGTIAFLTLGAAICVACAVAFARVGAVPWLLTSFWAGAATLLAGLLDLIGREGKDPIVGVTVVAVLSLLLLSALGLGQYVRMNWPPAAKAVLESLPQDISPSNGASSGPRMVVEQASGGRWAGHWSVRTRNRVRAWDALTLALAADGWRIGVNESCERLRAVKDGYVLWVVGEDPAETVEGPGTGGGSEELGAMALAAYVSVSSR